MNYPPLSALQAAGFETCAHWLEVLPAPQTDPERTFHRRLTQQYQRLGFAQMRRDAPHVAAKFDEVFSSLRRAAGVDTRGPR